MIKKVKSLEDVNGIEAGTEIEINGKSGKFLGIVDMPEKQIDLIELETCKGIKIERTYQLESFFIEGQNKIEETYRTDKNGVINGNVSVIRTEGVLRDLFNKYDSLRIQ